MTINEEHKWLEQDVKDDEKSFLNAKQEVHDATDWFVRMEKNYLKSKLKLLEFVIHNKITHD